MKRKASFDLDRDAIEKGNFSIPEKEPQQKQQDQPVDLSRRRIVKLKMPGDLASSKEPNTQNRPKGLFQLSGNLSSTAKNEGKENENQEKPKVSFLSKTKHSNSDQKEENKGEEDKNKPKFGSNLFTAKPTLNLFGGQPSGPTAVSQSENKPTQNLFSKQNNLFAKKEDSSASSSTPNLFSNNNKTNNLFQSSKPVDEDLQKLTAKMERIEEKKKERSSQSQPGSEKKLDLFKKDSENSQSQGIKGIENEKSQGAGKEEENKSQEGQKQEKKASFFDLASGANNLFGGKTGKSSNNFLFRSGNTSTNKDQDGNKSGSEDEDDDDNSDAGNESDEEQRSSSPERNVGDDKNASDNEYYDEIVSLTVSKFKGGSKPLQLGGVVHLKKAKNASDMYFIIYRTKAKLLQYQGQVMSKFSKVEFLNDRQDALSVTAFSRKEDNEQNMGQDEKQKKQIIMKDIVKIMFTAPEDCRKLHKEISTLLENIN